MTVLHSSEDFFINNKLHSLFEQFWDLSVSLLYDYKEVMALHPSMIAASLRSSVLAPSPTITLASLLSFLNWSQHCSESQVDE